jgi:predicted MFS family arabinose efflux permease
LPIGCAIIWFETGRELSPAAPFRRRFCLDRKTGVDGQGQTFSTVTLACPFLKNKKAKSMPLPEQAPLAFPPTRGWAAWRLEPVRLLMAMAFINMLGFAGWTTLFNNFAKEAASFSGAEVGLAQTIREIPGFLAFTAIFWFMILREQVVGYVALLILGAGIALTGLFPNLTGLLITTFIMSVGFHYFETVNQSLSLQLFPKGNAARLMGQVAGAAAAAQFIAYGGIALLWWLGYTHYALLFGIIGGACIALTLLTFLLFPKINGAVAQQKKIILRQRYWLYYALTFMSGARRQIFTVFAGFLLVEKFGYKVPDIALLMLATAGLNTLLAPWLGALIGRWGERRTITVENIVLIMVFLGYAFNTNPWLAAGLFVLDGVFATLTIAQRTYIQKIGDEADMAPTAACAFTINHIAAVIIPVTFGLLWLKDPSIVFKLGVGIAMLSLTLSFFIPRHPAPGRETIFFPKSSS